MKKRRKNRFTFAKRKTFFKYDENENLTYFQNDTQKQIATLYPNVSGAENRSEFG